MNQTLVEFAKENKAKAINKVAGPNGAFISLEDAEGQRLMTLPIGKKSSNCPIQNLKIVVTDDGTNIATMYGTTERIEL